MATPEKVVTFISNVGVDVRRLGDALGKGNTILVAVHEPFAEFLGIVMSLDGYLTKGILFADYVDNFLIILKRAFDLCKYVGEFIPVVGPALASVATFIENLKIEDKIRKILHEIKVVIQKARAGVLTKVKSAATKVCGELEKVLRLLPDWIDTAHIVEVSLQLVALLLPLCVQSPEALVTSILDKMKLMVADATKEFGDLGKVLHDIKGFIDSVWAPVKKAIMEPIINGFKAVWAVLEPVYDIVKHCGDVCATIKEWTEPFAWVMHAIQWLFEHTVGWLFDKIKDAFHIDEMIDRFMKKLEDSLGITAAKEYIENLFENTMKTVSDGLKTLTAVDIAGIPVNMMNLATQLQDFQKHPLQSILMVFDQGLDPHYDRGGVPHPLSPPRRNRLLPEHDDLDSPPRGSKRRRLTAPPKQSETANGDVESTPEDFLLGLFERKSSVQEIFGVPEEEVARIEKQQKQMDDFVAWAFPVEVNSESERQSLNESESSGFQPCNISTTTSSLVQDLPRSEGGTVRADQKSSNSGTNFIIPSFTPSAAPMLSLTSTESECISVIIRTNHRWILEGQAMARTYSLKEKRPQRPTTDKFEWNIYDLIDASNSMDIPAKETPKQDGDSTKPSGADHGSESLSKALQSYTTEVNQITQLITDTQGLLKKLVPIFKNADEDFMSFSPDALEFVTHFMVIIDALGPIFETVIEVMNLPEEYRDMEEKAVQDMVAAIGLPESFANIIYPFLNAIREARHAIHEIDVKRIATQALAGALVQPYKTLAGYVSTICSPNGALKGFGPNIRNFDAFSTMLYSRLSAMKEDFVCLQKMGQELHDSLGSSEDAQALLGRLKLVYEKLLPAAQKVAEDVKALKGLLEQLEATLYPLHEHVRRFFNASQELSTMCLAAEKKLLAADRVKSICARIHNALVPFRELLKGSGVNPGHLSSSSPALNTISELFAHVSFAAVSILLENFFKFDELQQSIQKLQNSLDGDVAKDVGTFEATLLGIVQLANTRNLSMYSSPALTVKIPVLSPLMDEAASNEFQSILQQANALVKDEDFQPGKAKTAEELTIHTLPWSRPDINQGKIMPETVRRWGAQWDKANPNSPGQNFVQWYQLLTGLEKLMKRREQWQRLDVSQVCPGAPPSVQPGSNESKMWEALEKKATEGGSRYHSDIVATIQDPLKDRLQVLTSGKLPLDSIAPNDLLRLLPSPTKSAIPYKYLPSSASMIIQSSAKTSSRLTDLLGDQIVFEHIRHDLTLLLLSLKDVKELNIDAGKAIGTLEMIHHDFNCVATRMFLEMTGDWRVAMKFLKAAEDSEFIKSGWLDPLFTR